MTLLMAVFEEEVLSTSSTLALDKSQPPTPDGTGLPVNFHLIGPGLFRSSYPLMNHFSILESYGFKTIMLVESFQRLLVSF